MKLIDIKTLSKNKIEGFINSTGLTTVEEVQAIPNGDKRLRARGIGPMFIQAIKNIELPNRSINSQILEQMKIVAVFLEDGAYSTAFDRLLKAISKAELNFKKDNEQAEQRGYNRAMEEMKNWTTGKLKFNREGVI